MEASKASESVELQLDLAAADFARFQQWHFFHSAAGGVLLLVAAAFLTYRVLDSVSDRSGDGWIVTAVVAAIYALLWFVVCPLYWRISGARSYASQKLAQVQHSYRIAAGGIASASSLGSSQVAWDAFRRAWEVQHAFYLYAASALAVVIPKRCFTSEEQMQRFRGIVRAGMGEKAKGIRG